MWSKTEASSKHRVCRRCSPVSWTRNWFCAFIFDRAWQFFEKVCTKIGMQSVCLFCTALQLSIPARNSHSAASKSTSYGCEQFSFHKNFACCFKIHLSEHHSVWCCWAEVWVKWHNFKPDLSFWCTLVYFNVRIKHGLVFFFCFFSWQDLRLVISTREMIFPENLWAAQGHGLAESC